MNVKEINRFAWRGVTANKTRSALTTLGILIGVAAVIILVAVGTGSSKAVADSINSWAATRSRSRPAPVAGAGSAAVDSVAGSLEAVDSPVAAVVPPARMPPRLVRPKSL